MFLLTETFSLTHVGKSHETVRALLYPQRDMAKNPHFDFNEEMSGSFAELRAEAERITMDAYWRDHADTLEEPFRTQLLDALDLFTERRAAES